MTFTYAVTWTPTDMEFDKRFEKYLDYSFFEHKVQWGLLCVCMCEEGRDVIWQALGRRGQWAN